LSRKIKGKNLVKARQAKRTKAMHYKAGAAKRTKVGQSLTKKLGENIYEIGEPKSITVPVNQEIGRNIGQPKKKERRFRKEKKITIIARRTDPAFKIRVKVARLDEKVAASGNVSSSWISYLEWNPINKTVTMGLLDGMNYVYKMSFKEYEGWYYAVSKGTYWHEVLKRKYYDRYISKYYLAQ